MLDLGLFPFKLRIAPPNFNGKSPGWLFSEVHSSTHGGAAFLRVFLLVLMYVCMCIACVFSPVFVYSSSVAFAIMVGLLGFYHVRPELLTCEFTQLHFLSISRPPFCSSVSKVLQYICNPRLFRFTFSSQWLMSLLWLMYIHLFLFSN